MCLFRKQDRDASHLLEFAISWGRSIDVEHTIPGVPSARKETFTVTWAPARGVTKAEI